MQDGLTELANRRSFDKYLAEQMATAIRHKRDLALVLFDVDHFAKSYNGRRAGDDCLKRIADALGAVLSATGDLVARIWRGNSSPQPQFWALAIGELRRLPGCRISIGNVMRRGLASQPSSSPTEEIMTFKEMVLMVVGAIVLVSAAGLVYAKRTQKSILSVAPRL